MPNKTHLKVLLTKDFLTLRRNVGFIVAFIFLPVGLMSAFIAIQGLVDNGTKEGELISENFKYTSTAMTNYNALMPGLGWMPSPFMNVPPINIPGSGSNLTDTDFQTFASSLQKCTKQNKAKYHFSEFAVVAADDTVRQNAIGYFQKYVFSNLHFPANWTATGFATPEELTKAYQGEEQQPFCAGVYFKTFDTATQKFEVQFLFGKQDVPDTNQPAFNDLIKAPDFANWDIWFNSGSLAIYPYITEFIARSIQGDQFVNQTDALFNQTMGYAPMESVTFTDISPLASQQLAMNFPFFFMIIYLIPFYYLTSKIASEKESKAREGMKMMGLTDGTYYISWFIFYSGISFVTSLIVATMCKVGVFKNVDFILFFLFCFLYGVTLYGISFTVVSFLPNKRSSSIAATLLHVISYYLVFIIADPGTPGAAQYGLSILPNVAMAQIVKQVFFYNLNTREGLTFSTLGVSYQNYSFLGGILMLLIDIVFWTILGLYCDQVVPSQFGVSKPWNFCCKGKKKYVDQGGDKARLLDGENVVDPKNFEAVSDQLKKQEKSNECLKVRGLVKTFGPKRAVNGTDLTMYNGQIFALLGHNGAGKTTTLSMLTGLLEPTEGHAEVFGMDIFREMSEVRKQLGVCPQHDVLFDFLTPIDHLRLFCSFKGTHPDKIEAQVAEMLKDIDLTD